jgi:hypothetical protein
VWLRGRAMSAAWMVLKYCRHPNASKAGMTAAEVWPVAIPSATRGTRLKSQSRSATPSNGLSTKAGLALS